MVKLITFAFYNFVTSQARDFVFTSSAQPDWACSPNFQQYKINSSKTQDEDLAKLRENEQWTVKRNNNLNRITNRKT